LSCISTSSSFVGSSSSGWIVSIHTSLIPFLVGVHHGRQQESAAFFK
jgi:hypothetical protein